MKKIILIYLVLIVASNIFGQITIVTPAEKEENAEIKPYDETKNFLGNLEKDVMSYVGQELFLMPKPESRQKNGYPNFYIDSFNENSSSFDRKMIYKPGSNKLSSDYDLMAGKIFVVDKIIKKDYSNYIFYMHQKDNESEKCAYQYSGILKSSWPFIVMSYFNFQKNKYVSKDFVIENRILNKTDFYTGDSIKTTLVYDQWKCVDLTVDSKDCQLILLFKRENQTSYTALERLSNNAKIFESSRWESLVKSYGKEYMDCVMERTIKIGMPVEILLYSWGEPDRINKSSYGADQYVYGGQYVYVENGKVKAWN